MWVFIIFAGLGFGSVCVSVFCYICFCFGNTSEILPSAKYILLCQLQPSHDLNPQWVRSIHGL